MATNGTKPSPGRSRTGSSTRPRRPPDGSRRAPSCSAWARNRRSARTAGCCWETGRSTGSVPTTTRCDPPGRSTPSCRSWPSADARAASRRSSSITRRTRSARRSRASARRHSTAWPRGEQREEGAGRRPSSSSEGPRARPGLTSRRAGDRGDLPRPPGGRRRPRCRRRASGRPGRRDPQGGHRQGPPVPGGHGRQGRRGLLHEADQGRRGRPEDHRDLPRHEANRLAATGSAAPDLGAGRPDRRRGDRGRPRRVLRRGTGEEIKRRSPFRYTYVFELANDYIGYIPDQAGFDRGGYQVWTGLHSFLERGTGERIVSEDVELLGQLQSAAAAPAP